MSGMKKMVVAVLLASILCSVAGGLAWHMQHYVLIGFAFYPKDAAVLDLRDERISVAQYRRLRRHLPDAQIFWNVEFQDKLYPNDITELDISELQDEDVARLSCFTELKRLNADQCQDYVQLVDAQRAYPQLEIRYDIPISGNRYPHETQQLHLNFLSEEDLHMLTYFTSLQTLVLGGAENVETAASARDYCRKSGIAFRVALGQELYDETAKNVTATGITEEQLPLLELLPNLRKLHLVEPEVSAETLITLRSSKPNLEMTWEVDICGLRCTDTDVEVDLSQQTISSIEAVERGMSYLPEAENVFLGFCGLDNEEIADYRERSRDKYKVVWVVDLSGKMKVRTDIDNFMPSRDGWGYVRDHEVDNIRYCEDLICIDLGHMGIKDVSFLETLVNLEYLILAHTEVQYIEPIVHCQKLRYLELDWSCIRDVSPLVELKALEDLNLGMTWPDITPILQMTWLKNLYLIKGNAKANFAEALPNTRVVTRGDYTVSNGWRNLPNYYAMRDILGMYYM